METSTILTVLGEPTFQAGLVAGAVAALVGLAGRRLQVDWGALWAGAVLAATVAAGRLRPDVIEGAVAVQLWVAPAALIAVGLSIWGLLRARRHPHLAAAVAVSVVGVWATIPDTETAAVQVGVTAALLWVAWPRPLLRIGRVGAWTVGIWGALAAVAGVLGRITGTIGGLGSVAALALFARRGSARPWMDLAVHVFVVVGWSRVSGRAATVWAALVMGVLVTIAGIVAQEAIHRFDRRAPTRYGIEG